MLKMQKLSFISLILMAFIGCEPNIDTQQIAQSAQNLRENVRNIDTQRITQGAQNLRENLQNFSPSSPLKKQNQEPTPESLKNTDPVLAEILGDVLEEEPLNDTQANQSVGELDTTRLSDENDFEAVSERQSIESDAERIESNRAKYVLIEPTSLPRRPGSNVPSIVEFAIKTTNPIGTQLYARPFASKTRFDWNCQNILRKARLKKHFLFGVVQKSTLKVLIRTVMGLPVIGTPNLSEVF